MTIRALMDGKKRRIMAVALFGFAFGVTGLILAQQNLLNIEPRLAGLPGFGVSLLALFYANLVAFRCPRCGRNWGALVMHESFSLFTLDQHFRYCPWCGADIDAEVGANQKAT